jgi:hypothetical protein
MDYHFHGSTRQYPLECASMNYPAGLTVLCCLAFHPAVAPASATAATADAPHEHGVARLQIAVTGDLLELRLRTPLHTLLGFETAPRNQKQRQAVQRMAAQLHRPEILFVPTLQARCLRTSVVLTSEAIAAPYLAPDPAATASAAAPSPATSSGRQAAASPHPDLNALISYQCGNARLLTGLQVRMFETFPALRQIDVEIATPRGHSGARLSPNRTGLTW